MAGSGSGGLTARPPGADATKMEQMPVALWPAIGVGTPGRWLPIIPRLAGTLSLPRALRWLDGLAFAVGRIHYLGVALDDDGLVSALRCR
eukprot:3709800-Karenia_brevis.AAC.1